MKKQYIGTSIFVRIKIFFLLFFLVGIIPEAFSAKPLYPERHLIATVDDDNNPNYQTCTSDKLNRLSTVLDRVKDIRTSLQHEPSFSRNSLKGWFNTGLTTAYTKAFDNADTSVVKTCIDKIAAATELKIWRCDGVPQSSNLQAKPAASAWKKGFNYLLGTAVFFPEPVIGVKPASGQASGAGTLIHEMSHELCGTVDTIGADATRLYFKTEKSWHALGSNKLVNFGDSYRIFAEESFYQRRHKSELRRREDIAEVTINRHLYPVAVTTDPQASTLPDKIKINFGKAYTVNEVIVLSDWWQKRPKEIRVFNDQNELIGSADFPVYVDANCGETGRKKCAYPANPTSFLKIPVKSTKETSRIIIRTDKLLSEDNEFAIIKGVRVKGY